MIGRKVLRWLTMLGFALLAGCGGGSTSSVGATGTVTGFVFLRGETIVLRATNAPGPGEVAASGAAVSILSGGVAFTTADGSYLLTNIDAGTRTLRVDINGLLPLSVQVIVVAGQTTTVGEGGNNNNGGPQSRRWTVMVYLNGDGEREAEAIAAVNAMEQVGSTSQVAIDVLLDRVPGFDATNGDWTGARRFLVEQDTDPAVMTSAALGSTRAAEDLGELDLGDPQILKQFVSSGIAAYPASHYLLIINGPGSGWRGVSLDATSGNRIDTLELESALSTATHADVVAFDASFMAMLEVAYQVRTKMSYLVGSQAARPPAGYPYEAILQALVDQPSATAATVAESIVNLTVEAYTGQFEVAQSAIRTSDLGLVDNALDDVGRRLQELDATRHDELATVRAAAQRYGTGAFEGYVDLIDLVNRLTNTLNDGTLTVNNLELLNRVNSALAAERHTGSSLGLSHGLSLYFPDRAEYLETGAGGEPASQASYADLELSSDTHWEDFLDGFAGNQPAP